MLKVSREGFRKYIKNKDKPWKYEALAEEMKKINSEDECNDTYGRVRMFQALNLKNPEGIHIPSAMHVNRMIFLKETSGKISLRLKRLLI